ncbi:MAG TPA: WGR domain-containing protein, partial [Leptospiraceae bacterium]|nr:WGR domain-containing protein [Leptospiraceae bacterium]
MKIKRLEFSDGKSNKFWEITLDGVKHTVIFGKINTPGQTQLKEFDSEPEALKAYEKLLQEKLKKGYAEVSSKETEPSSVTENQTPVAKPTSKTKAKNVSDTSQSTQMV